MTPDRRILIGIDGGGTYTRVAVTDPAGNLLAYVQRLGASSLDKDLNARENTRGAILEAIAKADRTPADVIGLGAGIAGFDDEEDLIWVRETTNVPGLNCPMRHVNDAVAAHAGAFFSQPGIIAICGTGSIIFGVNESGRQLRNYDFGHYATAARFITQDTVHELIARGADETDAALVQTLLAHFGVNDIPALAHRCAEGFDSDKRARMRLLGDIAPAITDAAQAGSHLARRICDRAADALITGIRLLGACFSSERVSVALIGGAANSAYIKNAICERINAGSERQYAVAEPALPAALGGALLAMEAAGVPLTREVAGNLRMGKAANHFV